MITKKISKPKMKTVPKFKSLEEEAFFWDNHDFTDFFDFSKGKWGRLEFSENVEFVYGSGSRKDESVTIRFQSGLMKRLKEYSASKGLSVSSLIRMWSIEKLQTV